jgi:hypothetical protein
MALRFIYFKISEPLINHCPEDEDDMLDDVLRNNLKF